MDTARAGLPGAGHALSGAPDRPHLLERVDDAAVVQLYADGFADLSLREKTLAWHLSQAALAGRDIYYDQRYAPSLGLRCLLEGLLRYGEDVAPDVGARIHHYAKLFWLNSGPHNNLTARKFTLRCDRQDLFAAARSAAARGAALPVRIGESVEAMLGRMAPLFFDPDVDSIVTSKTPGEGRDILSASANNLYEGVTMGDLDGFTERYALNSRLAKRDGRLVEEVYRTNGLYGDAISAIVGHLEAAMPFAPAATAASLRALVAFYRSGEPADREAYDIAWVRDGDAQVDTINGFVEVYLDARGMKGAWEASYVVAEVRAFRDGVGRLLVEVQRIKSQGDFAAARALVEEHGVYFDAVLRDEIVSRVQRINMPSYTGFVMPALEPVFERDGSIGDVRVSYPLDLTTQMLAYSAHRPGTLRLPASPLSAA